MQAPWGRLLPESLCGITSPKCALGGGGPQRPIAAFGSVIVILENLPHALIFFVYTF